MKKIETVLLKTVFSILVISVGGSLYASSGKIGAGFILGVPTGITGKVFISNTDAVDLGLGATGDDDFYIYGDYLKHFPGIFPARELALYVGAGAAFYHEDDYHYYDDHHRRDDDHNCLEIRVPVGLEYTFNKVPIGVFIELVPALEIVPDIDSDMMGGIGARYYF